MAGKCECYINTRPRININKGTKDTDFITKLKKDFEVTDLGQDGDIAILSGVVAEMRNGNNYSVHTKDKQDNDLIPEQEREDVD